MKIHMQKRALSVVALLAIMLSSMPVTHANYSDVPSGAWYQESVNFFIDAGYLDASQPNFRGGDLANRAEFVKLIV
ncbi:hypothetical protein COW95_01350, partial [Candidatus Peregrinibacteria bacterium CG22_combo_CG10-13_8_21_14_all_49_11]